MTPQQHEREATNRKCRVRRAGKRSPDSESARRELSKSGRASHVGPQTMRIQTPDLSPRAGAVGGHSAAESCEAVFGMLEALADMFRRWKLAIGFQIG